MAELKTLKDFEVNPKSWAGAMALGGRKYTIDIPELKQEAIKQYKEIEKISNSKKLGIEKSWEEGRLSILKHFFNITEEDLKNDK